MISQQVYMKIRNVSDTFKVTAAFSLRVCTVSALSGAQQQQQDQSL